MALFQLVFLATLVIGSFADHEPHHFDYTLPNSHVNFNTPAFTYNIPEVAIPVLPSFHEIGTFGPKQEVRIPSTSYGSPVGPVRNAHPALLRPSPERHFEFTNSGEIETNLFDIFGGNQQQNVQPFLEYNPPTTTRKPPKPVTEYYVPTTTRKPPTRPVTEYFVPTTTRKPPTKPATEYHIPITTTTTRRPTTTRTTTRAPVPTKPSVVYGSPPVKPATEYFVPSTTTTTTTTTTRKPTTTTTTTTTRRPTTTTTTTTTRRPTTTTTTRRPTTTTTTTEKVVAVYGLPDEKPVKPFDDYGPPMLPAKPFEKVTKRPFYPYPAAGVPDLRHQHYHEEVHIVPSYIVRKIPNPFFRIPSPPHFVPVQFPTYMFYK